MDASTAWKTRMNNTVDALVKKCVQTRCTKQLQKREKSFKVRETNIARLKDLHLMWHDINQKALTANKNRRARRDVQTIPVLLPPVDVARLQPLRCCVDAAEISSCPFSKIFAERVIRYFDGLPWDWSAPSVSLLELYIDFTLATGTLAPVLRNPGEIGSRGKVLQQYYLPDLCPAADDCSTLLADQISVRTRMTKWLLRCWTPCPWTELVVDSKTAHRCGFLEKRILGLQGYPKLRMGGTTGQKLWSFFHPTSGVHRSLRLVWGRSHVIGRAGA